MVAVFVDTLTDNTTRTVGDVRSVFNKFDGNLELWARSLSCSTTGIFFQEERWLGYG